MLANFADSLRIFLHVLGASIWVGGQIVLALLVPMLRKRDADLPKAVARAFNKIGWPAFALLLVTGMWNLANPPETVTSAYQMTLGIKMFLVVISGCAYESQGSLFLGDLGSNLRSKRTRHYVRRRDPRWLEIHSRIPQRSWCVNPLPWCGII
jgi:hypothetical protein